MPQLIALIDLVKRQNKNLSFLTEIIFDKATIEVTDEYEGSIASHYVAQLFDLVDLDNLKNVKLEGTSGSINLFNR